MSVTESRHLEGLFAPACATTRLATAKVPSHIEALSVTPGSRLAMNSGRRGYWALLEIGIGNLSMIDNAVEFRSVISTKHFLVGRTSTSRYASTSPNILSQKRLPNSSSAANLLATLVNRTMTILTGGIDWMRPDKISRKGVDTHPTTKRSHDHCPSVVKGLRGRKHSSRQR